MTAEELLATLSNTIRELESQDVREHNRNFNRQIAKAKEVGNIAGKMIALTGQQLYAVELGAEVSIPLLNIYNLSAVNQNRVQSIDNRIEKVQRKTIK